MGFRHLPGLIAEARRYGRREGLGALGRVVLQRLRKGGLLAPPEQKPMLPRRLSRPQPIGAAPAAGAVPGNTLNWFVPPFQRGSGGHLNVFRFIGHLEAMGFVCRIVIDGGDPNLRPEVVRRRIAEWFQPLRATVHIGAEEAPPAAIAIATGWRTAYTVRDFQPCHRRCYFVQDYEPWFYPSGGLATLAARTYEFGFTGLVAGGWLRDTLVSRHGMSAHAFGFASETGTYAPRPRARGARQVFFYARPHTPRRGFEMGLLVLAEVVRRMPDVIPVLAGGDLREYEIPFAHTALGVVEPSALADVYSQCDAALVLSFSNLSLLPLELMACGTPVVSNAGPQVEWLLTPENARLAAPTVEALADALVTVLSEPAEQERLRAGGLKLVAATDWKTEAARVAEVLHQLTADIRL